MTNTSTLIEAGFCIECEQTLGEVAMPFSGNGDPGDPFICHRCLAAMGVHIIAVTGSRIWTNEAGLRHYLGNRIMMLQFTGSEFPIVIVTGGARGADRMGAKWADDNGFPAFTLKPDWTIGRHAATERNSDIIEAATVCIAFPDGSAAGTWDTVRKARTKGIPIHIYGDLS